MSGISLLLAEVLSSGTYRFAVTMTIETPSTSWRTVSTGVVESAGCWAAVSARTAAVDTSDEAMKSSDGPQGEPASQPTDRFMDPPFTSRAVAMPQQSAMLCRDPCQCRSDRVACHRNWAMTPALEASHTDHVSPAGGHRSTSDVATVGTLATVRRASRHRADGHPPSRPRSRAYWRYRSGDFARG